MKNFYIIGFVIGALLLIIIPLTAIWALNTLFPVLAIPYSVETWIAAVILYSFFNTKTSYRK